MTLADILALRPSWLVGGLVFVFGLLWGSFLNVVIYRVPLDMSVVSPPSHCPGCGAKVAAYDNVPVLSFLVLRGRARCCGKRMSPRYLFVELIGGALSLAIFEVVVRALPEGTGIVRASAVYLGDYALALALVAAAFIDLEHMYLPDSITLGGTVFGIATATLRDVRVVDSLLGAFVGFVAVWLPFNFLYKRLRGKVGMGTGDAKLTMLAGAWFGWPGAIFALFAGAFQGTAAALVVYLTKGKLEEPEQVKADREELQKAAAEGDLEAKEALEDDPLATAPEEGLMAARLPFGPFLILGILEYLFVGPWIRVHYLAYFMDR